VPRNLIGYHPSGQFHFITFSCNKKLPLLDNNASYSVFQHEFESVRERYGFVVVGYGLMPEHVHLLTDEPRISSLVVALQVLKQKTSRKLKSPGLTQSWQRRYYDFNIYTEAKTAEKLKYMHRNPVRRELVTKPEDWSWSSFRHYAAAKSGTVEIESEWTARRWELEAKQPGGDRYNLLIFYRHPSRYLLCLADATR
jgi:putative transposase